MAPPITCECGTCAKCKKREYQRKYLQGLTDEDRKQKSREASRKRRIEKKEQHRQESRIALANWRKNNPEKYRLQMIKHQAIRRARKKGCKVSKFDLQEIMDRDRMVCYICGEIVSIEDLHFDHVIPLCLGGSHSKENLSVTHSWCNLSKSGKFASEAQFGRAPVL